MKSLWSRPSLLLLASIISFPLIIADCAATPSSIPDEGLPSELIELKTRPGVTLKFILIKPENPVATVVIFEGGPGWLRLRKSSGKPIVGAKTGTVLVRNREEFAKHGLMVALVDAPSDKQTDTKSFKIFRQSKKHVQDIRKIVSYLKNRANIPIWLAGISMGTFSVSNCGIHIKEGVDGLILVSSVTQHKNSRSGIFSMDLSKIAVPTVIVANKDDKCPGTPPSGARKIKESLVNSPRVEVMYFKGGKPSESRECGPLSPHGYYGIEDQVVPAIAGFITSYSK